MKEAPPLTELQKQLERFRFHYPSIRVRVTDDSLIYKTSFGYAKEGANEANELISFLDKENPMPLIATTYSRNEVFTDGFIVQQK